MNKTELVEEIARKTRLPAPQVAGVLEAFIDTVERRVIRGDRVTISGFGTFHRKARARRTARNILADQPLSVPARNIPAFRPGKPFREAVGRRRRAVAAQPSPKARGRTTRKK